MKREQAAKSITDCVLLYAEDDGSAAHLFKLALSELSCTPKLFVVTDGNSVLQFLSNVDDHGDSPRPDLVVLDLNLPGKDGFDTLEAIRRLERLADLPVVIFTSSQLHSDRERAERLGVLEFLHKPISLDEFWATVDHICSLLPTGSAAA